MEAYYLGGSTRKEDGRYACPLSFLCEIVCRLDDDRLPAKSAKERLRPPAANQTCRFRASRGDGNFKYFSEFPE